MSKTLIALTGLCSILFFGTTGYMLIEDAAFLDSLYMTVITISSVGFGEKFPLTDTGRLFTIALIFGGCGFLMYVFGTVTEAMVEVGLQTFTRRRKMEKKIGSLDKHYIVCGYGRIGREISRTLKENALPFVVVEHNESEIKAAEDAGSLVLAGDAATDETLEKAGIARAQGLVSVVSSDADNVYIVLSARVLNADLFIMARSSGAEGTETKLKRAGADKVISPYTIGARRMAQIILRPTVIDFIDVTTHGTDMGLRMEEFLVQPRAEICGKTLLESRLRQDHDIIVVAIKRKNGGMHFNPNPASRIEAGDILIMLGQQSRIKSLEDSLNE